MEERVALRIGPARSDVAKDWVLNRRQLVDAARRSPTVAAKGEVLDLLEFFLDLWLVEASRSDTFDWSYDVQREVLLLVARYWLDLGELTTEERAAMGVPSPPPHADAFTDVVVRGMAAALRDAGPEGQSLLDRLGL